MRISTQDSVSLTIFYDSECPLCRFEIDHLKANDKDNRLLLEDINAIDFMQRYPYIDKVKANKRLHGQLQNGELIFGLDVSCMAWNLVGKHQWLSILRLPVIRWFADLAYYVFARNRNWISPLLAPLLPPTLIAKDQNLECQRCK